jgi:hypothetical protein
VWRFSSCVAAFVFCALLEFTLVNYLWRKPVSQRAQNGARGSFLNGGEALTRSISAGGLVRRATSEHQKICTTTEMDLASASIETKPLPPAQSNKQVLLFCSYDTFFAAQFKFPVFTTKRSKTKPKLSKRFI